MTNPFTSAVELHTFRGQTIREVFVAAVDFLEKSRTNVSPYEVEILDFKWDDEEDVFIFSLTGRYVPGKTLDDVREGKL